MVLWPGAGQHRAMETSNDRALDAAIADFNARERRFGRTSEQVVGAEPPAC